MWVFILGNVIEMKVSIISECLIYFEAYIN